MRKFTMMQWENMPKEKKGRVSHALVFSVPENSKRLFFGRQAGHAVPDRKFIGARTLLTGKRMLIEGLDFKITDDSLI